MTWLSTHKRLPVVFMVMIALGLLLARAWSSGWLRPFYTAGLTELRLIRRGDLLVQTRHSAADGMMQIRIPKGEFVMGSDSSPGSSEYPAHKVYLDAYWIDQVTATNSMYAKCVQSGQCQSPARYNQTYSDPKFVDYPIVYVNWFDAQTFCSWESGRLPTEAEWEKAARGVDQLRFPWGSGEPDNSLLNFNSEYAGLRSSYDFLTGASPYGLLNMAGNARQWVADWYDPKYYLVSPDKNPQGPASGVNRSLRGGGDFDKENQVQTFHRESHDPTSPGENRSFRCVHSAGN